jgi:CHAD domain-containing protein
MGRAQKKSDKRFRKARKTRAQERGEAWHRARKTAKRTRYAAELARPALGKKAKKVAGKHERRQDWLGEIQDERMTIRTLLDLATSAPADEAFTCGVLAQRHAHALAAASPD